MSDKINTYDSHVNFHRVKESDLIDNAFESNVFEFTEYYRTTGQYDIKERLVRMYVIKFDDRVVGYVTLAMTHLKPDATEAIKAKEINGNIPALLISHLAVHKNFQRRGIGTMLLKIVFGIASHLGFWAGCRYVMLNPRDDQGVKNFYTEYGFDYHSNIRDDKNSDAFLMDLKSYKHTDKA